MKSICSILPSLTFGALLIAQPQDEIRGINRDYLDPAVSPCADFYGFANGAFAAVPIPSEYASWGVNEEINERTYVILREILESAAKTGGPARSVPQRVGDFYAAGMDEAVIERSGLQPLQTWLNEFATAQSPADLFQAIAHLQARGFSTGFRFGVQVDEKDTTAMISAFNQGGLGLPDRDYYFREDLEAKETRTTYVAHIAQILELAGASASTSHVSAAAIMSLETKLAQASRSLVERSDPEKNYHKFSRTELAKVSAHLDWETFFAAIQLPATESTVLIGQPEFFTALGNLLQTESRQTWSDYLRWQLLRQTADYLGVEFVEAHFAFYGTKLRGTTELQPRWKRVMFAADEAIGEDIGQLYVKSQFSPSAKIRALEMVSFHLEAMRQRIRSAAWMSESTKTAAYRKIDTMRSKVGYPDSWREYSKLTLTRDSYLGNVIAARAFESARQIAQLGQPVDRSEWFMTPQTNNAYYDPSLNEMCFPAGILQPPFFDERADDATNYGALASTIGHELTHGFDDSGRQYDHEGNLKNWWAEADVVAFQTRAEIVARQYDAFEVLPGLFIEGEQTISENIADIGGLRVAYDAYKLATKGKVLETIDVLTPDQRFFLAFAQSWRTNQRPESLRLSVTSGVHSPARWRVLGPVANFPEFRAAFDCEEPAKTWDPIW
jgi:putative endopeptidase